MKLRRCGWCTGMASPWVSGVSPVPWGCETPLTFLQHMSLTPAQLRCPWEAASTAVLSTLCHSQAASCGQRKAASCLKAR